MRTLLVTGASGFIGGHVVRAALSRPGVRLRLMRRARSVPGTGGRIDTAHADLTDPGSLTDVCEGVDAVLHCASRVTGDGGQLRAVNDLGTRALVDDALRHGVDRIVYMSTAAVYGHGPFRDADAGDLPVRPSSDTSRTRAAAERHVLGAGGTVLRPHLVYGAGDQWVIPGLARLLRFLGAGVDCSSVHSAVEVGALADTMVRIAVRDDGGGLPGVVHVNHPEPMPVSALIAAVLERLDLPPREPLPLAGARARVSGVPRALHDLEMLASDHWFASDRVWQAVGRSPGPAPLQGLAGHMPWYEALLRTDAAPA
ncbi:NAD-dependent epimerase/dehydratase family protein [Streptomyces coelicoflavus]|uniref:NAD-dependent epimerase/dehydratase family protein n=1 Tax=Streptomyces coelicoflavus TaxID=285562 RepID=A0A7K3PVM8_9ACTN|nr:NAD-dependent epimerase/dehydratase family protein [Streptomyces coelicoflavus]NEB13867.1 NAD-dependent epimerase/dehydratase family protein [Streptomyces coelicoflavus]